jgi:dihydroceramide fatty acyl 2-hydroxylase
MSVDISEPILLQVERMSAKEFRKFVVAPIDVGTAPIQLYDDPVVDRASWTSIATNWRWVSPIIMANIALGLFSSDNFGNLMFFIAGLFFLWPLTEYYMHNFVLHGESRISDGPNRGKLQRQLFARHLHHHVFMKEKNRIALAPRVYLRAIPLGWGLAIAGDTIQEGVGASALLLHAGWLMGSLAYDTLHQMFHHGPHMSNVCYRVLRQNHLRHHYRHSSKDFGVTNPWCDVLFGTYGK